MMLVLQRFHRPIHPVEDRESATRKRQIECTTKYLSSHHMRSMKTQVLDYHRYVDEELHNLVTKKSYPSSSSLQHDLASHFVSHCAAANVQPVQIRPFIISLAMEPYLCCSK